MQLYIVLAVMVLFIVGMIWNKFSFGTVAMVCVSILAFTGVLTPTQAFGGFANKNLLMMAGMFVIAYTFGKTSLVAKLQKMILSTKGGKSSFALVAIMLAFTALLAQFISSQVAILMIMMTFLSSLGNTGDVTASRMMLPVAFITTAWLGRLPIGGMGVSGYIMFNGFIQAAGGKDLLNVFSIAKATIFPALICLAYCVFTYKWLPNREVDLSTVTGGGQGQQKQISKKDEIIIYAAFILSVIGLMAGSVLGDKIYIIPIGLVLVMILLGTITSKEAVSCIANPAIFMAAGIFVLSDAMTNSGAGKLVGQAVISILGGSPGPIKLLAVISFAATIMTSFVSNTATIMVLAPIACNICMAAGYDPRAAVIAVSMCSLMSMVTPMSSNGAALAFSTAKLNVGETLKWTVPLAVIGTVATIISCYIAYPM